MEEIISVIDGYAEIFPKWFIIAYLLFLVTGVITACKNKKNFNRVFWLIIVIVFPFYGTAVSVICCIVMSKISKNKSVNMFDYPLEKKYILLPLIFAVAGIYISEYAVDYYRKHIHLKWNFPLNAESVPVFLAAAVLLLMFMSSYSRYRKSAVCFHINKSDLSGDNEPVRAGRVCGCQCIKENKNIIPDKTDVKNISFLYYKGSGLRTGDTPWKYKALSGGNDFNFDVILNEEFEKGVFDIETAKYMGKGITKITAFRWNDLTVNNGDMSQPVTKYVMWHVIPPFAPEAFRSITSLMMIFAFYTPLGINLFLKTFDSFTTFFS